VSIPVFLPYEPRHREGCLALFDQNCPDHFAPNERADFAHFLDASPHGYLVTLAGDEVIAAFGVTDGGRTGRRRINWILVSSAAQGHGLGAVMMREAISRTTAANASVLEIAASHRSAPFFAKFGAYPIRHIDNGWGMGMHRVDMELRVNRRLLTHEGGDVVVPQLILTSREDGGHLIVNPPREVWERSELTRNELTMWSLLVAATGRAMLDVLPQLSNGCINYWEAGNWALHDDAEPRGRKDPRIHRRVHLHLLGRYPQATHPSFMWGEAPRFPAFADRLRWSADFTPLTADECDAVVHRTFGFLDSQYGA
jgi:GNAT superfamily N-acetyltransferase/diadenosine tetraphosphate (Ap4A) HIT family hydrolase